MREVDVSKITDEVKRLCIETNRILPADEHRFAQSATAPERRAQCTPSRRLESAQPQP